MINNRLFKKINSIFWGILSWMPVFLFIFMVISYSLTLDINTYGNGFDFETYFNECISYVKNTIPEDLFLVESFFTNFFVYLLSLFTDLSTGVPTFAFFIVIQVNWFLLVQLIRLGVYVFMWFINFIYDLFDYLSFKRKGDN